MIHLNPSQILSDRPFTHVRHNATDVANLERMRHALAQTVRQMTGAERDRQHHLECVEDDGRAIRHIIVRPRDLLDAPMLVVVGFCGHKCTPIHLHEQEEMAAVDAALVEELHQHPHMLSYCSIETGDGNWHNLVLLSHDEGMQHWRDNPRHGWAVDSLAPRFYEHIRLHNGLLPRGLASDAIMLTSTKYDDFSGDSPWRAIRLL